MHCSPIQEEKRMDIDQDLKQKVTDKPTWTRGLYILLFIVIYSVAELVMYAVVVFQFLFSLFTGSRNEQLLVLGKNLSTFIYEVLLYITYNSDDKPYPFGPWPGSEAPTTSVAKKKKTAKKTPPKDNTGPDTGSQS
jgi:hypothetical protein